MAEGKRPARRVNRPAPPSPQDVAPSSQGVATVGEIARGTEYDAILGLASPKTIYIMDCAYTPEQAEQISRLRHERWNLLARFNEKHGSQDNEWSSMNNRMRTITKELFDLTGNPIYNVEG
jgi:hypothetical protein